MNCEIVRDLLPLYHDGVCSRESREAVEEHLRGCEACRKIFDDLDAPLPEVERKQAGGEATVLRRMSQEWKRTTWRARLKGAAAAALVCGLLVLGWFGATELIVFPVPMEKIELSDLRQLPDGRILYHFRIDDDLNLRVMTWDFSEDGDVWLQPKRALYTEKRDPRISAADEERIVSIPELNAWARVNGVDADVVRIWYGKGEDRVLLWEAGMELPDARRTDRENYGFDQESADYWKAREE